MITAKDIKERLVSELVGKPYECVSSSLKIIRIIRDMLIENGLEEESRLFWTRDNKQQLTLVFNGHIVGCITIKKSKGESHHSYYGQPRYDWTYKDIDVSLYEDSIEDCIIMSAECDNKAEEIKRTKDKEAVEIIKLIRDNTNMESLFDIASMCKYIYDNQYKLSELL